MTEGVQQGSPLAPHLFNIVLDGVMENLSHMLSDVPENIKIQGIDLVNFDVSDGLALSISNSADHLQQIFNALEAELGPTSIMINANSDQLKMKNRKNIISTFCCIYIIIF